jgi:hypothetical protein
MGYERTLSHIARSSLVFAAVPLVSKWHNADEKSKVATQQIFRENTKQKTIADSGTLNRAAEVACGFDARACVPLTSLHESRAYSPQKF